MDLRGARWRAATVVESRSYAPEVPLQLRAREFAALPNHVDEVLSVQVQSSEMRPRSTRAVPTFAPWFEPRVEVGADLAAQIAAMGFAAFKG